MAARTLEKLQEQYNAEARQSAPKHRGMPKRGGPRGISGGKPKDAKKTIRRLLGYIWPYRFRLLLVIVCMLVSTVSSLVSSYILRPIINSLVTKDAVLTIGKITFTKPVEYLAAILMCGVVGVM